MRDFLLVESADAAEIPWVQTLRIALFLHMPLDFWMNYAENQCGL